MIYYMHILILALLNPSFLTGFPDTVQRKALLLLASPSKRPKDTEPGIFKPKNPEATRHSNYRGLAQERLA